MPNAPRIVNWLDDERLACPRTQLLAVFDDRSDKLQSTPEQFILMKSRSMIDWYEAHFADDPPSTVLEIGIFKGGSAVLFSELWRPTRLAAVDIAAGPIAALEEYIDQWGLQNAVHPLYGIDQADKATMRSIIAREFDAAPIDLVVDDGCHFLHETRASFEAAFPFLRPGGQYVIEDWAWTHWAGSPWQDGCGPWPNKSDLTMLALELAILSASRGDLVESVTVNSSMIIVKKGDGEVPDDFELSKTCLSAGRVFSEKRANPVCSAVAILRAVYEWRVMGPLRWLRRALRRKR